MERLFSAYLELEADMVDEFGLHMKGDFYPIMTIVPLSSVLRNIEHGERVLLVEENITVETYH